MTDKLKGRAEIVSEDGVTKIKVSGYNEDGDEVHVGPIEGMDELRLRIGASDSTGARTTDITVWEARAIAYTLLQQAELKDSHVGVMG